MKLLPRLNASEASRFWLLAFLFFINSLVLESNEVVATSGFISNVGVPKILIVWATVFATVIVASSAYSLFVDRIERGRFAVVFFMLFSLIYLSFYFIFSSGVSDFISYGLLAVVTEQQWLLFPLLIWALANDMFTISEAKRLFPMLAAPAILGGLVGNGLAAAIGQIFSEGYPLLVFNAALILVGGMVLILVLPRFNISSHQSMSAGKITDVLNEGISFIREVPTFRYLTIAMVLMGVCLNIIEYQFLVDVDLHAGEHLQTFYGIFKIASSVGMLLLQFGAATWLLNNIGFKNVFLFMPGALGLGLVLALFWITPIGGAVVLTGAMVGDYFTRITLAGIDEPSRRAFEGLVPDQRRGRVSAFMNGILYPLGSIIGAGIVGLILILGNMDVLSEGLGRTIYISIGIMLAAVAIWLLLRFRKEYDVSSLNWRLKRRKKGSSVLDNLEF